MDEFAEKRGMVKMLLDMLKRSAADEVANGMKPPEGMPEDAKSVELEKVSAIPHDHMEAPEHESPEEASMADQVMHKGEPEASHDMPEMDGDDMEMDDEPSPAFSMLMKKKGKK